MYLGKGESGAKIILVGEHAVVYGIPAIALPFNGVKTTVEIYKTNDDITIESRFHNGYLKDGSNTILGMQQLIYFLLDLFKKPKFGLHFKVISNIEPQRGLGSSASLSVATTRAIFDAFEQKLSNDDLIIIDTKMMSQTKLAVNHVSDLKLKNPKLVETIFDEINKITLKTIDYLQNNNVSELARLINRNQTLLEKLGVSNDTLEKTIANAKSYGALGAKLTGGGMGGCIIGITKNLEDAKKIIGNFKKENISVWLYPLGEL